MSLDTKTPTLTLFTMARQFLTHRITVGIFTIATISIAFLEYVIYNQLQQMSNIYKTNFPTIATAAAQKVAEDENYCIIAPDYKDKHNWLILNNFIELNIDRVLKQAVLFRLHLPSRVKKGVNQRVPHFSLYAKNKRFLWSFSKQSFVPYHRPNNGFDHYMWLVCQDLATRKVDRRKASFEYQIDPKWIKIHYALQNPQ